MNISSERRQINGEWVKALRKRLGLNQEELAQGLGISRSAVARWELNAFRPSKLAARVLLEFAAKSRVDRAAKAKAKATPLTGLKRRLTLHSQSRSSRHDPGQRVPHPGTA